MKVTRGLALELWILTVAEIFWRALPFLTIYGTAMHARISTGESGESFNVAFEKRKGIFGRFWKLFKSAHVVK